MAGHEGRQARRPAGWPGVTDRSDAADPGRPGSARHRRPDRPMDAVARRTPTGWRVGDEEVSDLTSAMVLADLLAADLSAGRAERMPRSPPRPPGPGTRPAVTPASWAA